MRKIYLPTLKKIEILDFSIYNQNIEYEFVEGVNLIIGGNGLGKTTFINLIKYGLVGLYSTVTGTRTYKEERKDKRGVLNKNYFKNRMSDSYERNEDAKIILYFNINNSSFKVTRGLYNIELLDVEITENGEKITLDGKISKQDKFDRIDKEDNKKEYLQYNYESQVIDKANFGNFDDLIFFVNEILYFDEDRKTILWDTTIQAELSSKYLNDPQLDEDYKESKRMAKYHDSLSRHKSEDIRAIRKILDKIDSKSDESKQQNLASEINNINKKISLAQNNLEKTQESRKSIELSVKKLNSKQTKKYKEIEELDEKINSEETSIYHAVWKQLNPSYPLFLENLQSLCTCPMCNQMLEETMRDNILAKDNSCILCSQKIVNKINEPENLTLLRKKRIIHLQELQNIEAEIFNEENNLEEFDKEYNKIKKALFANQNKIRDIEHSLFKNNTVENSNLESVTYSTMMLEIEELELEKKSNQESSKKNSDYGNTILKKMEHELTKVTRDLSSIFSGYAEDFLGYNSKLVFDEPENGDIKRFIPYIDGKERNSAEELSESQRFFIDQSFRMSLLSHFYSSPSFFICETPDSSLDISYESNAAKIYLKYLSQPNSLIITSNLNNSEFLENIISEAPKINCLNLLYYGKPSDIQKTNEKLTTLSKRIEEQINAKG